MRRSTLGTMLALAWPLILLACAPSGGEEPAVPAPGETETVSAAADSPTKTAPEETATKEHFMSADPNNEADDQERVLSTEAAEEGGDTDADPTPLVVTPAVVDLGDITPDATDEEASEPVEMPQPGIPDPAKAMSNKAATDLARRLDVDVDEVNVASVEATEWRDSSLGCPQPGQNYMMVITPGFTVVLEAQGQQYKYHTDRKAKVVFCGQPTEGTHPPVK